MEIIIDKGVELYKSNGHCESLIPIKKLVRKVYGKLIRKSTNVHIIKVDKILYKILPGTYKTFEEIDNHVLSI